MRLAIVGPHFPEYCLLYANAMASRVATIAVVDSAQLAQEFEGRALPYNSAAVIRTSKFKSVGDLMQIVRALRDFQPTVLHLQEAVGPRRRLFNFAVAVCLWRAHLVLTVHDPLPHEGRDNAVNQRGSWLMLAVRLMATAVVLHGDYCATAYSGAWYSRRQRLIVSDHGVLLQPTESGPEVEASTEQEEPDHALRVLFFGRMEAYKGVGPLVEALEGAQSFSSELSVEIAGSGPELDKYYERLLQLTFVRVSPTYVPAYALEEQLRKADCVVLPYQSATQSGVLSAAFGARCFVIATNVGGIPDVVDEGYNGLLVEPGNADAIRGALREAASSLELRGRLRRGAMETARTRLSWDRISDQLYRELAELHSAGSSIGVFGAFAEVCRRWCRKAIRRWIRTAGSSY